MEYPRGEQELGKVKLSGKGEAVKLLSLTVLWWKVL